MSEGAKPARVLRYAGAGAVVGTLTLVTTISYVSLIFIGPLAPFRDAGLAMALFGATVHALFGGFASDRKGFWWGNQSPPVIMVAIASGGIAATVGGEDPVRLFATVAVFIAASTFLTGLALFLLGRARLGQAAKFIPYPVVGGFLAATGVFLILRGAQLVLHERVATREMFGAEMLTGWAPYAAGGLLLAAVARRTSHLTAMALGAGVFVAGFYGYLWLEGMTLAEAETRGLLLNARVVPIDELLSGNALPRPGAADLSAVLAQAPTMLALAGLSILAMVMNITGIEIDRRTTLPLNGDMVRAGLANMIAALGGGFVGFHSVSMQRVARSLVPGLSAILNATGAALLMLALAGGLWFIAYLPVGVFALVLSLIGFELLLRWLVDGWRTLPKGDYALVVAILAITLVFDFATAVVAGIVAASLLFTLAYSRVRVVRSAVTGRLRRSATERPDHDAAVLAEEGAGTLIFELQGYLFFGTANSLFDRVAADIAGCGTPIHHLILDFRRVEGMDVSTAFVLVRLAERAAQSGAEVVFTALSPAMAERLKTAGLPDSTRQRPTLEDALAEAEARLLSGRPAPEDSPPPSAFGDFLERAEREGLPLVAERRAVPAGEVIFEQGRPGDDIAYLEDGTLAAVARRPDGSEVRLARFLPGAVVGEIAFSNRSVRTASIIAEEPSRVAFITRASLEAAAAVRPGIATEFHALLARLLSDRLGRTTALLHALDR